MKVSIIIPNWNGVHVLKKYLTRVVAASRGAEIIVADDCSTDGSVEYLVKNFPNVTVVSQKKRLGFAANVNAGVKKAKGDIAVLLNTDVEPEENFLEPLLAPFSRPNIFAVGCLEKSHEKEKIVLRGRGLGHWEKGFFIHACGDIQKSNTAWVSGGSSAFRKSMWNTLGGMDEVYGPFYWEDIDLSYRARKAGWNIVFEQKSVVHHYHEEGSIQREFSFSGIRRIVYRNQFIFIWKNATDKQILLLHIMWTPIRLFQAILRADFAMISGFVLATGSLLSILRRRKEQAGLYTYKDRDLDIWD